MKNTTFEERSAESRILEIVKRITGDFIKSNNISVEKYISEKHLELYFQTRTRSVLSTCIDYLNGLILLQYRKNIRKMAIIVVNALTTNH